MLERGLVSVCYTESGFMGKMEPIPEVHSKNKDQNQGSKVSVKVNLTGYKEKIFTVSVVEPWNSGPEGLWTFHKRTGQLWTG